MMKLLRHRYRPVFSLLCLALASAPFLSDPSSDLTNHNAQRIAELFAVTSCCLFWLLRINRMLGSEAVQSMRSAGALISFFVLGAISCLFSYSPFSAAYEWANFLLLTTLAFAIAEEVRFDPTVRLQAILHALGIGAGLYLFKQFLLYTTLVVLHVQPSASELISGFDNIRFFNHVQTVTLPLLILWVTWNRFGPFRRLYYASFFICSLWWAVLFLSGGRGTLVGVIVGIAISIYWFRAEGRRWRGDVLKTFIAGIALYTGICYLIPVLMSLQPFGPFSTVISRTITTTTSGRVDLWMRALEIISEHPLLGGGPLHFAHYAIDIQAGAHPHNWMLQIGAEWGVPALICITYVVSKGLRSFAFAGKKQAVDDRNGVAWAALLSTGIGIIIDGLVSGLFVMPVSQLAITLYCGCALGWYAAHTRHSYKAPVRLHAGMAQRVAIVVALICLWTSVWPQLKNFTDYEDKAIESGWYQHGVLRPRLWSTGYF